jgi:hypothetical protein
MTEGSPPLHAKLSDLETALHGSPQSSLSLPKMEDLKSWLDDTRLQLWGKLQAATEENEFPDRFRIRRAVELCQRLSADVSSGQLDRSRPELVELGTAAAELARSITAE